MPYGIMRIEKRKRTAVFGLQIEANRTLQDHKAGREFQRSDINWRKTGMNYHIIKTDNWLQRINELTDGMRKRKDSVLLLDGIYTASPEFFEKADAFTLREYWEDCLNYHIKEFCGGDRTLVINAVVHLDETTPHLQIASVPILKKPDGTRSLSAREIMGDTKAYRRHQDRFYEEVSSEYGMERGERSDEGHKRQHLNKLDYAIAQKQKELTALEQRADEAVQVEALALQHLEHANEAVTKKQSEERALDDKIRELDKAIRIKLSRLEAKTRFLPAETPQEKVLMEYIDMLKTENHEMRSIAKKAGLHLPEQRIGGRDERAHTPVKAVSREER